MNRMCAAVWMLVLVLGTGCPVGGEEGVLHEALLKDEVNRTATDSCREADVRAKCGPDGFASCMEECLKKKARK